MNNKEKIDIFLQLCYNLLKGENNE